MTIYKWLEVRVRQPLDSSRRQSNLIGALVRGVSAAITGAFLVYFLSAVAQILIVRELGKLLYGEYVTLSATLGLMASALGFGFDVWVLNEGGRDPANLARNISLVLRVKLVIALVMLLLVSIAWSNHIVEAPGFVVGVVGIICDSFASTSYSALRALRRNGQVAVLQVLAPLALVAALWLMPAASPSILLLYAVQTACSALLALVSLGRVWKLAGSLLGHAFDLGYLVRGAWLFVAADVLSNIYSQSSIVILGRAVGPAEVGLFKPALNVIGFTFLVPSLVFLVGLPQLNAAGLSRRQYLSLVRVMAAGALLYGLAVWAGLAFFGQLIIRMLFGAEYDAALPLVRLMSLVPLFKAGSFVCVAILLSLNRPLLRVSIQAVITVASLVAGVLLIPVYGLQGAVWLYTAIESSLFVLYMSGSIAALRKGWR
jgi:O-antigen/teichoic acid export membrane protein